MGREDAAAHLPGGALGRRAFGRFLSAAVAGMTAGGQALAQKQRPCEKPGCECVRGDCPGCRCTLERPSHICKGHNTCKGKGGCQTDKNACAGKNVCKGQGGCAATAARHECAGKNACKGMGGCKSGDAGCAGKNSCKGKGGCATPVKADHGNKKDKSACGSKGGCKGAAQP
jgi:hypothetical protein